MLYRRFFLQDSPAGLARTLGSHLGKLGGTFLLIGQALSFRHDWFPAAFCEELGKLRDTTPPLGEQEVRSIVEQELGRPIDEMFSSFETAPLRADWLGQSHRAAISESDPVIVTLRRPALTSLVESDLAVVRVILWIVAFFGVLGRPRSRGEFATFQRRVIEGLSLVNEARKADRLAMQTDENQRQYVPQVYWAHTTENVLTTERVNAVALEEMLSAQARHVALTSPPVQESPEGNAQPHLNASTVARNLLHNHLHQVLNGRYVHCNPVPANLAVLENGTIVYVDCRAVERIDPRLSSQQMVVLSAARAGDLDSLFQSLWSWVEGPWDSPVEFEASFYRRLSDWLDSVADRQSVPAKSRVRGLLAGIVDDFRRFQIPAPEALLAYYNAFSATALTAEALAPEMDIDAELAVLLQEILTARIEKKIDARTLAQTVLEYEDFLVGLPHQFHEFMRQVRRSQWPVVRTINLGELRTWNLLQLLTSLATTALVIAWLWSRWNRAGPQGLLSTTFVVIAILFLLVLRRVCQLNYDRCAMGHRRMRYF
jgi:predicted unusual protein kinase regulating ubiquinone biosynthesis (AarF/ABC1/UbiB family)